MRVQSVFFIASIYLFKSRLSYIITEPVSPTYIAEYITICEMAMSE